jgi:DUF971 family protein
MQFSPTAIGLTDDNILRIEWDDGHVSEHPAAALRDACPCASCREKRRAAAEPSSLLPVLSLEEAQPTRIVAMKPVGNYAYGIHFNDGHDTGIFTLEFLRSFSGQS